MRSLLSKLGSNSAASIFSWPVLLASIAASVVAIGVQQVGVLEEAELNFFDQLIRLRPDEGPDPRLLVVTVTEEDIQALAKWPTEDQTLDKLLGTLEKYQPRVIGLDIYRNLPIEPGNIELATRLEVNDNIITVCKVGDSSDPGVPPPPTVPESRVGFSDLVVDPSGIVRRSLLVQTPEKTSKCAANQSLSLQLALNYLEKQGIQQQLTSQDYLQIGSTIFKPIEKDTVGYQNIDARGYQVLLNYRSPSNVARQVTLTEVLADRIDPSWVKDRIVLIGVTAASGNDFFYTPYSKGQQQLRTAGVLVHAQMVSQILSAVLDKRSLIWFWPGWVEVPWVLVWSLVGGGLAWRIRNPLLLLLVEGAAVVGLVGICYAILTQEGWVPLLPPALALVASGAIVISYRATNQSEETNRLTQSKGGGTTVNGGTEILDDPPKNPLLGGRYKIIEAIGSGGFGQTFLAEDTKRPRSPQCVVKQLVPARKDEKFLEIAKRLFEREAETLEEVGKHDQIPQLLAYFEEDKEFYLVQEFIKGQTLSDELTPDKRLPESQVVALIKDVLGILDFIHSYGVIHRDIKPANIIRRGQDRRLVLIDFGAVKQLQTDIKQKDVKQLETQISENQRKPDTIIVGTAFYGAPELFLGQPVFNSDIYSLGIVGIQAVTGKSPTQLQQDGRTKQLIWRDYAQVSDELAVILDKMVRYHSSERYQSAAEALRAFQHF